MSEYIRPDEFSILRFELNGELQEYAVNAKYDRIDYFPKIGAYILKIFDDEVGLSGIYLDEENAIVTANACELPIVYRDFMFDSEHENWLIAEANNLSDDILD